MLTLFSRRSIGCGILVSAEIGVSVGPGGSDGAQQFQEAGPDDDLRAAHTRRMVEERREEAQRLRSLAASRLSGAYRDRIEAEQLARSALGFYARSLDWAEDTEMESEAHELMDRAGRWVNATFGCQITWNGSSYVRDCPVALAHNRIGLSVGGIAKRKCSLCGLDVSECDHLPGTAYLVPGGSEELGWCRICLAEQCDHSADDIERVSMVSIIHEMELEEVSIVDKPAQPEARITALSLSTKSIRRSMGLTFVPGDAVPCDRCAGSCDGLVRHGVSLSARPALR